MPDELASQESVTAGLEAPASPAPLTPEVGGVDDVSDDAIAKVILDDANAYKQERSKKIPIWKNNIERRVGSAAGIVLDAVRSGNENAQQEITPDWYLSKAKIATLYSKTPRVRLAHENAAFGPAVAPLAKELNYRIGERQGNLGAAMEGVMSDVVNAAGFGAIRAQYVSRSKTKLMWDRDTRMMSPEQIAAEAATGALKQVPQLVVVDRRFPLTRISPKNVVVPKNFDNPDFNQADFLGEDGEMPWALGMKEFRLRPGDRDALTSDSKPVDSESLRLENDTRSAGLARTVKYTELFYWRYRFDPEEPCLSRIWRLVFVGDRKEPAVHEPWKCQAYDEQTNTIVGPVDLPIQICTVTYISDNPLPPSDTRAGAPQVDDLRRSRAQIFANRQYSIPMRWLDINRVDPLIQEQIRDGVWQGIIPMNGDGNRAIGEVARASYPSEDLAFDSRTDADLLKSWSIGPDQLGTGAPGRRTKAESEIIQGNYATRMGQERNQVAKFVLAVCRVLLGLVARYSEFPTLSEQEKQQMFQAWDNRRILHDLAFSILPDSTVVLESGQRVERIKDFLNGTAQSGYVNPKNLIAEWAELAGIDPADCIIDPTPKEPEKPNVSYRFAGKEDMMNPMVLAILGKAGLLPSPEELQAAVKMLKTANEMALAADIPPLPSAGSAAPLPPGAAGPDPHPDDLEREDWEQSPNLVTRAREL